MLDLIALITLIFGLNIPLFWIPIHSMPNLFKKLGILTYIMPLITGAILAFVIYLNKDLLLRYTIELPIYLNTIGIIFFTIGTCLHIWTGKLLGLLGLVGIPELSLKASKFVATGPFSIIRHPTYLAHTLMFAGIFLFTEIITIGILTLFDFLIVNLVMIPLEEKELLNRFGNIYKEYKRNVKWRLFPGIL